MNENLNLIFLDLKSKLRTNLNSILMDDEFIEDRVQAFININKRAIEASYKEKDLELTESINGVQQEDMEEEFELLQPFYAKIAPIKLAASKTMSVLNLQDFTELDLEIRKEESNGILELMQAITEKAQFRIIDELVPYEEDKFMEEVQNKMQSDELVN